MKNMHEDVLEFYYCDMIFLEYLRIYLRKQLNNYSNFLLKDIENINQEILCIEDCINQLKFPHRDILYYKYIKRFSYNKIADKINYSIQRTFQLRKDAIKLFSKIYKIKAK